MPDSDQKTQLRSYARLWSEDMTPVVCSTLVGGRDSGHIIYSGRKIWLRSYIMSPYALPILVDVTTPFASPDFGRASRLRSMSVTHVLPPQLWKTLHGQARWLQHLIAQTLSQKQTMRDAWLIQCSKPQYLMSSHIQVSGHVPHDRRTLSLAWSERNLSI
jgi:hypothetical protein